MSGRRRIPAAVEAGEGEDASEQGPSPFDAELAAIDALLARSDAVMEVKPAPSKPPGKGPAWSTILIGTRTSVSKNGEACSRRSVICHRCCRRSLPSMPGASSRCFNMRPWLGPLLAAAILRQAGVTTRAHLAAFNLGLKSIPVDRRRDRDREIRLLSIAQGLIAAAELGLKGHDRLAPARQMMERKLTGRRMSSKLPEQIELVMAKPLVSAGMVGNQNRLRGGLLE